VLKLFELWIRHPDLTRRQALDRYTDEYAPMLAESLGLDVLRYVGNFGVPAREAAPYDGIDEYWLDAESLESLPGAGDARARQRSFVGANQFMLAEPIVHVDHARHHRGIKSMFLLTRRPEMTRDESMAYWRERHVPLVMQTLGAHLVRYTTNVGLPTNLNGWPGECSPYDGIAELWLDLDVHGMYAFVGEAASTLLPDERAFLGTYRVMLAEEQVHRGHADDPLPQ